MLRLEIARFTLVNALLVAVASACAPAPHDSGDSATDAIAVTDRVSPDSGPADARATDVVETADGGSVDVVRDSAPGDAISDTGMPDDAITDTGVPDDAITDTGAIDDAITDTGAIDDAITDTGAIDGAITDTGAIDDAITDTGAIDDATTDASAIDDAFAETGMPDVAPPDAADDVPVDTGSSVDVITSDTGGACASGTRSCGGVCVADADPRSTCGSACVDLASDPLHCGTCGTSCPATQICSAGTCRCGGTTPTLCAAFGACVDTTSDARHCGSCGHACGAGESCIHSYCQLPYTCSSVDGSSYAPIVAMANDVTGDGTRTLASIMAVFPGGSMRRTPGLSLAVREADGTIHATVFGDANNSAFDAAAPALNRSTLFQAGSVSKPVSALAYLMSEIADPTRTTDIRPTVASLVVPPYAITPSDLLTHTAGTSVHGFTGYLPGAPLPTIDQIVLGASPANSMPVTFGTPGSWLYSGGGYILWEAWLERTASRDLPSFVHDVLFVPAGATRSNFAQPLAASEHDAACGSDPSYPAGVCRLVEPEYAAAGLWTTPTELACIAGYATSRRPDALTRVISRAVPIPSYPQRQGLGLRHRPANGVDETAGHFYEHSGVNIGYCNTLAFFSDGRAIVAMDNSCAGVSAVVVRAMCLRLGWSCGGPSFAAF